jgi:hypothetical protein
MKTKTEKDLAQTCDAATEAAYSSSPIDPRDLATRTLYALANEALRELNRRGCVLIAIPVDTYPDRRQPDRAPFLPCELYSVDIHKDEAVECLLPTVAESYPSELVHQGDPLPPRTMERLPRRPVHEVFLNLRVLEPEL